MTVEAVAVTVSVSVEVEKESVDMDCHMRHTLCMIFDLLMKLMLRL